MRSNRSVTATFFLLLLLGGIQAVSAAEVTIEQRHVFERGAAEWLDMAHLAGPVRVRAHEGDGIELRLEITAGGETESEARQRAETVTVEDSLDGDRFVLRARFPLGENPTLYYQPEGRSRGFNRLVRFDGQRVTVQGPTRWGRGVPIHAAVELLVPEGMGLDLEQHAGSLSVTGLDGSTRLRLHGDSLTTENTRGVLDVDTGDGDYSLSDHDGEARIRTGAGHLAIEGARGGPFRLNTGSGGIRLRGLAGNLEANAGSGGLQATEFLAGRTVAITSGSGDIFLEGDISPVRDLAVETTGGDIFIHTAHAPDAEIAIRHVRGGITVDLPDLKQERTQRNRYDAVVGEGTGRIHLESRMGQIRLLTGPAAAVEGGLFDRNP